MPTWPIESIRELLEPTLAHMGYEIYALQQAGPGGRTLRIAIDKRDSGVTLDDCERVSEVASPLLDQADLIPGSYTLEVSSPGAERPLRSHEEYERFLGRRVNVRFRTGDAEGVVEGALVAVDENGIAVRGRATEVLHLPWEDVVAGRLAVSL
jgi:ribosome maturation factor RimP